MGTMNGLNGDALSSVGVSVKTEPMPDLQQSGTGAGAVYYRLTPSPPPNGHQQQQQAQQQQVAAYGNGLQQHPQTTNGHHNGHSHNGAFSPSSGFDCNDGCSPVSYSPSSPASPPGYDSGSSNGHGVTNNGVSNGASNGVYSYPTNGSKSMSRQSCNGDRAARGLYDDDLHSRCDCLANPASGHTVLSLSQQLQRAVVYLQRLPEHSGSGSHTKCALMRRVMDLKSLLQCVFFSSF